MTGERGGSDRRIAGSADRDLHRDDRGAALAFTALAVGGDIGMLALAIDLGMLYEARTAAQRTADAAALAGAAALVDLGNDPGVEDQVYDYALPFVEENRVRGETASVQPSDVTVNLEEWRVTVTVHRTADRGNAVETLFGSIVGADEVDVSAVATAEAVEAGGVNCLLPIAIPDRWYDADGDGLFEPEDEDYYIPQPGEDATGYGTDDIGTEIVIKPFQKSGRMNASWWYPWRPPGQQGAADYRENIVRCMDEDEVYDVGATVTTEPGAMVGPTKQGFRELIQEDPDAYWDAGEQCVARPGDGCVDSSPRIRPAPMFDPREAPDPGHQPFTFTNFASIFVKGMQGNEVHGVLLGLGGVSPADDPSGSESGPAFRITRLVR